MQFSLKWMFAATAYVAVACLTIAYASDFAANAVGTIGFVAVVAAVIAATQFRGRRRAFWLGFAVAGLFGRAAVQSDWQGIADVRFAALQGMQFLAESLPDRATRRGRQVIERFDVLEIEVGGLPDRGLEYNFTQRVDSDGSVAIGVNADVGVAGLTTQEAEAAINQSLKSTAGRPTVQVSVNESARADRRRDLAITRATALKQHGLLLFAVLGGLLGRWCWRRQAAADAAADASGG